MLVLKILHTRSFFMIRSFIFSRTKMEEFSLWYWFSLKKINISKYNLSSGVVLIYTPAKSISDSVVSLPKRKYTHIYIHIYTYI